MDFLNVLRINCEALGPLKMWGPWERGVSFVNGQLIARPFARIDKLGLKSHQIRRRTKSCSQECNTIDTAGPNVWCWLSQSSLSCVSGQMAKKQSHPPKVNHSCVVKPGVWSNECLLVIPNDHLWKGRLTQRSDVPVHWWCSRLVFSGWILYVNLQAYGRQGSRISNAITAQLDSDPHQRECHD